MPQLDQGRAWNLATTMITANKDVIGIVAGVFFFLPNVAAAFLMPQSGELAALSGSQNPDPAALWAQLTAFYADVWWVFLLMGVAQAVGVLGLLALLTDHRRPTVGEALLFGIKALIPYLVTQLLVSFAIALVIMVLVAIGAVINVAVAVAMAALGMIVAAYIWTKFALVAPVMAIEGVLNPLAALKRSWSLTKGNSVRLFTFFLLLVLVLLVVSMITGLVFSMFGLLGAEIAVIVSALGGGLLNMAFVVVMLAVLAAVHQQLSGGTKVGETFE